MPLRRTRHKGQSSSSQQSGRRLVIRRRSSRAVADEIEQLRRDIAAQITTALDQANRDARAHNEALKRQRRDWIQIVVTALPGLAAVAALFFTGIQISASINASNAQLQNTEQGQITDRYNAAITNLGSPSVDVRLGGIYALQRIMQDSPRDVSTIIAVLCAFVRDHASLGNAKPAGVPASSGQGQPSTDVQAAVTVVADRDALVGGSSTFVDLNHTNLAGANLTGDFRGADFTGANLSGAFFSNGILRGAYFSDADLSNADLDGADLSGASLAGANLSSAGLVSADLTNASLQSEDLTTTFLYETNFTNANLFYANLSHLDLSGINFNHATLDGADLSYAKLSGSTLSGADLTGANLTRANLFGTNLTTVILNGANLTGANLTRAIGIPTQPPIHPKQANSDSDQPIKALQRMLSSPRREHDDTALPGDSVHLRDCRRVVGETAPTHQVT